MRLFTQLSGFTASPCLAFRQNRLSPPHSNVSKRGIFGVFFFSQNSSKGTLAKGGNWKSFKTAPTYTNPCLECQLYKSVVLNDFSDPILTYFDVNFDAFFWIWSRFNVNNGQSWVLLTLLWAIVNQNLPNLKINYYKVVFTLVSLHNEQIFRLLLKISVERSKIMSLMTIFHALRQCRVNSNQEYW